MKASLTLCAVLLATCTSFLTAQDVVVSARLEARNADGTPISAKYVFPRAELASGEMGTMHIGEAYRYEGVTVVERDLGLVLSLTVTVDGDTVFYNGEAKSTQLVGETDSGCSFKSAEAVFAGSVDNGEMIALWLKGPSDDFEAVSLHFAIKAAGETATVAAPVEVQAAAPVLD